MKQLSARVQQFSNYKNDELRPCEAVRQSELTKLFLLTLVNCTLPSKLYRLVVPGFRDVLVAFKHLNDTKKARRDTLEIKR